MSDGALARYSRGLLARAGVGRTEVATGRHPVELLAADPVAMAEARICEAVAILQSSQRDDETARADAFKALTGAELLILVDEVPC